MALIHGGDGFGFEKKWGRKALDFSANTSPLGLPGAVREALAKAAETADAYPDPLCRALKEAIAVAEDLPEAYLLCGNGAADLIYRAVLAQRPRKALLLAPSFAEYAEALKLLDCEIVYHRLDEEKNFVLDESILDKIDLTIELIFICNPNNPTGLTIDEVLLQKIVQRCKAMKIRLILDECFNGFLSRPEAHSMKEALKDFPNMLILKAFTKLYGMAGIRLGYALCADALFLEEMQRNGAPWSVSSLAQAAGISALEERGYLENLRSLIESERPYLKRALQGLGLRVIGGEANYIFFYSTRFDLKQALEERGLLIRDCSNYPALSRGYYRVAVRGRGENTKLIEAMRACLGEV